MTWTNPRDLGDDEWTQINRSLSAAEWQEDWSSWSQDFFGTSGLPLPTPLVHPGNLRPQVNMNPRGKQAILDTSAPVQSQDCTVTPSTIHTTPRAPRNLPISCPLTLQSNVCNPTAPQRAKSRVQSAMNTVTPSTNTFRSNVHKELCGRVTVPMTTSIPNAPAKLSPMILMKSTTSSTQHLHGSASPANHVLHLPEVMTVPQSQVITRPPSGHPEVGILSSFAASKVTAAQTRLQSTPAARIHPAGILQLHTRNHDRMIAASQLVTSAPGSSLGVSGSTISKDILHHAAGGQTSAQLQNTQYTKNCRGGKSVQQIGQNFQIEGHSLPQHRISPPLQSPAVGIKPTQTPFRSSKPINATPRGQASHPLPKQSQPGPKPVDAWVEPSRASKKAAISIEGQAGEMHKAVQQYRARQQLPLTGKAKDCNGPPPRDSTNVSRKREATQPAEQPPYKFAHVEAFPRPAELRPIEYPNDSLKQRLHTCNQINRAQAILRGEIWASTSL